VFILTKQSLDDRKQVLSRALEIGAMDDSMIKEFNGCQQKYEYVYEIGLFSPVGEAALFSGDLIHPAVPLILCGVEVNWDDLWYKHMEKMTMHGNLVVKYPLELAKRAAHTMASYTETSLSYMAQDWNIKPEWLVLDESRSMLSKPDLIAELLEDYEGELGVVKTIVYDHKVNFRAGVQIPIFSRQIVGQILTTGAKGAKIVKCVCAYKKRTDNYEVDVTIQDYDIPVDILARVERDWGMSVRDRDNIRGYTGPGYRQEYGHCYEYNRECHFMGLCAAGSFADPHSYKKINPFGYLLEE